MKTKLLLAKIIIIVFSASVYSQANQEIAITYGKSRGYVMYSFLRNGLVVGTGSSKLENNNSLGVRYLRTLKGKEKTKIEVGLNYLAATLKITPAKTGDSKSDTPFYEKFKLVSAPIYGKL